MEKGTEHMAQCTGLAGSCHCSLLLSRHLQSAGHCCRCCFLPLAPPAVPVLLPGLRLPAGGRHASPGRQRHISSQPLVVGELVVVIPHSSGRHAQAAQQDPVKLALIGRWELGRG